MEFAMQMVTMPRLYNKLIEEPTEFVQANITQSQHQG